MLVICPQGKYGANIRICPQISVFALICPYLPPYSTSGICAVVSKIIYFAVKVQGKICIKSYFNFRYRPWYQPSTHIRPPASQSGLIWESWANTGPIWKMSCNNLLLQYEEKNIIVVFASGDIFSVVSYHNTLKYKQHVFFSILCA